MALSDREQKIIEEMERALQAEDPRLVATMERRRPSLVLNILAMVFGIALLLGGVIAKLEILGIVGFLVALAGVATIRLRPQNLSLGMKRPKGGKMQERWDRRNQQ